MQYRKKAVVIDAIQWNGSNLDQCKSFLGNSFLGQRAERHPGGANVIMIKTLEGQHIASLNDFLIRGVKGEHYPCKPDIFAATYDAVSDGEEVGMYKLNTDPNHHRVVVGDFTITRMDDKTVWIESESRGDGGSFSDADFEATLKQFYEGHF